MSFLPVNLASVILWVIEFFLPYLVLKRSPAGGKRMANNANRLGGVGAACRCFKAFTLSCSRSALSSRKNSRVPRRYPLLTGQYRAHNWHLNFGYQGVVYNWGNQVVYLQLIHKFSPMDFLWSDFTIALAFGIGSLIASGIFLAIWVKLFDR